MGENVPGNPRTPVRAEPVEGVGGGFDMIYKIDKRDKIAKLISICSSTRSEARGLGGLYRVVSMCIEIAWNCIKLYWFALTFHQIVLKCIVLTCINSH
jgi:hypothetical protein